MEMYNKNCGLSEHEWHLEKIIDTIKKTDSTLENINLLKKEIDGNQRELLIDFAKTFRYRGEGFLDCQIKDVVNTYIKGNL